MTPLRAAAAASVCPLDVMRLDCFLTSAFRDLIHRQGLFVGFLNQNTSSVLAPLTTSFSKVPG